MLNEGFARLADGDRAAAEPVFRQLWPVVSSFALQALKDESRAQDVAQQALMKLFEQASRFDPKKDALAWALEITAWEIRSERRRIQRSREDPWDVAAEAVAPNDPEMSAYRAQLVDALSEAFSFLSANDRQTLSTVLLETAPPVTGATWRKRKQRALTRFKEIWRKVHEDT